MFDGASPNLARDLQLANEGPHLCGLAEAQGISYLFALQPDDSGV